MRNVLTAGDSSHHVVDHFPVTRASRWKQQNLLTGGAFDMMSTELDTLGACTNDPLNNRLLMGSFQDGPKESGGLPSAQLPNSRQLPKRSGTASYIT